MKKIISSAVLLLISFSVDAQVIISELNDPQTDFATNRWIEITNISSCDVDLGEYRIIAIGNSSNGTVAGAAGGSCTWNPSGILAAGASVTFGGTANTVFTPTFTSASFNSGQTIHTNWNGQNRDGARLEKNGVLVDLAWISNDAGDFFENNSKKRNANVCQGDATGNNAGEWFNGGATDHAGRNTHTNSVSWCGPACNLPIELVEFRAFPIESSVELSWTTSSEYNNDFFTIEKSNDGQIFTPLINVKGNGNSTNLSYYSEVDGRPYLGTSYYRLKQTDFDGATTTSNIVAVNFSEVNSFNISPNPALNHFYIQGQGMEEATVLILNSIGQEIKLIPQTDNSYFRYDTSNLEKGNYLVRIIYQNTTHVKKLIVQ